MEWINLIVQFLCCAVMLGFIALILVVLVSLRLRSNGSKEERQRGQKRRECEAKRERKDETLIILINNQGFVRGCLTFSETGESFSLPEWDVTFNDLIKLYILASKKEKKTLAKLTEERLKRSVGSLDDLYQAFQAYQSEKSFHFRECLSIIERNLDLFFLNKIDEIKGPFERWHDLFRWFQCTSFEFKASHFDKIRNKMLETASSREHWEIILSNTPPGSKYFKIAREHL